MNTHKGELCLSCWVCFYPTWVGPPAEVSLSSTCQTYRHSCPPLSGQGRALWAANYPPQVSHLALPQPARSQSPAQVSESCHSWRELGHLWTALVCTSSFEYGAEVWVFLCNPLVTELPVAPEHTTFLLLASRVSLTAALVGRGWNTEGVGAEAGSCEALRGISRMKVWPGSLEVWEADSVKRYRKFDIEAHLEWMGL